MLVAGAREQEEKQISVRLRTEEDLGSMPVSEIGQRIVEISRERRREL